MNEREENIRFIRSKLPYMGESDLRLVSEFIRGISSFSSIPISPAEWERHVLSEDEQRKADNAQRVMDAVKENIKSGEYAIIEEGGQASDGANILGERHGDTVAVSLSALAKIHNEIWYSRLTKAAIAEALEASGVILPRSEYLKFATIGGFRKESVYIPVNETKFFTGKEAQA